MTAAGCVAFIAGLFCKTYPLTPHSLIIRMHTAQGPSHSMFTAHNITVNNGVFNQYIAGEQQGEITIKFKFSVFD